MIDSHAHLFFPDFEHDLGDVIHRAKESGIRYVINAGTNRDSSAAAVQLAKDYPGMFALVGVHPNEATLTTSEELGEFETWLDGEPKVLGIGEVGLDYYRKQVSTAIQRQTLINFLKIAERHQCPIVLHIREAYEDVIQIVRDSFYTPLRAVSHCFSGKPEDAERLIQLGFCLSFSGSVTYPKNDALRESVRLCPLTRLFVETDSPYLAPQAMRGKRNEPSFLLETMRQVAEIKELSLEALSRQMLANARGLFDPAGKFFSE